MRAHASEGNPTGSLQRAALILGTFAGKDRLNLSQIVAATGLPRTSVHRALEQLVTLRWLHRTGMDYRLGMGMIELGSHAAQQNSLRRAALPSLHWLHHRTGCTVHLGVLDGSDAVFLEKIGGDFIPGIAYVGGRIPADASTIGAALLSVTGSPRAGSADGDGTGIVYGRDRGLAGFSCLAIPIGAVDDADSVAAISVFGRTERIDDRQVLMSARTAAVQISRRVGALRNDDAGRRGAARRPDRVRV